MWIKREVFTSLRDTATKLKTLADQYYAAIGTRDNEIKRLHAREIELLQDLGIKIATEAQATTAADIWRTRVNELTLERAELLRQLIPGLKLVVPVVERDPIVTPPGVDFEDMGNAVAMMTGALQGDGELRVDDAVPASVKGAPGLFRDPAEADDNEL